MIFFPEKIPYDAACDGPRPRPAPRLSLHLCVDQAVTLVAKGAGRFPLVVDLGKEKKNPQ